MIRKYVSFDAVKEQVSMMQVLEHYGLLDGKIKRKRDEITLRCVFHDSDKTPSLKVNTTKNVFNCFGCGAGGDVIGFVALKEGLATSEDDHDRREAALRLQEWFQIEPQRSKRGRTRTGRQPAEEDTPADTPHGAQADTKPAKEETEAPAPLNPPLTFSFQHLDSAHPYFAEQGLSPETIATFSLGYHAGKGIMSGRVVIPIHDEQGELVAYAGRWPGEDPPEGEPKYKFPPNFHKSHVLFNLHRARVHARDGLIVVEGFFSGVFTLWQKGRKNVVAVMGSSLSTEQERLIVETVGPKGRVLLAFDQDDAGRAGMQEAADRLVSQVFVRTVELG